MNHFDPIKIDFHHKIYWEYSKQFSGINKLFCKIASPKTKLESRQTCHRQWVPFHETICRSKICFLLLQHFRALGCCKFTDSIAIDSWEMNEIKEEEEEEWIENKKKCKRFNGMYLCHKHITVHRMMDLFPGLQIQILSHNMCIRMNVFLSLSLMFHAHQVFGWDWCTLSKQVHNKMCIVC